MPDEILRFDGTNWVPTTAPTTGSGPVGTVTAANLPAGSAMAAAGDTRPTTRPDITVFWRTTGATPSGALPGDILMTGGSGLTPVITEPFTGTNGAAVNGTNWTATGKNTAASTATIQSNRGRWYPGTTTAYGAARSMKLGSNTADGDVTGTFQFVTANDGLAIIIMRCDTPSNPANGYFLVLSRTGSVSLTKWVSFAETTLATQAISFTTGVDYKFRMRLVGTSIKAKVWAASAAEPDWTMQVTDSSVTASNAVVFEVRGGSTAGMQVDFDDVVLSTVNASTTLTLSVVS